VWTARSWRLLQAAVPLMVAILAHFLFVEEPFRPGQFIGLMTGLAGILLIVGPVAVFGGRGVAGGRYSDASDGAVIRLRNRLRPSCRTSNPAALACGQQACGAVVAAVISLLCEPVATWNQPIAVWLLLAVVGVICSAVPTALYLRLLARAASLPAALVAYLQPVWATILGWAVLGEPIRAVALLGTAIVVAGIALTTRRLPS